MRIGEKRNPQVPGEPTKACNVPTCMQLTEREKVAHLLRRFGLGASEAEINYYGQDGLKSAIDLLLNYEPVDEGFSIPVQDLENAKGALKMPAVQAWWMIRMVVTKRPLQEKMTLFWHNHFATSAAKVTVPDVMYRQNEILRENATGNFRTLLREVSKDAAMLFWLDNQYNVKGKPNENFAREVMELFTLGIGNYTEKDVQEAARAFTGWTFGQRRVGNAVPRSARFIERAVDHDNGTKTVLGTSGALTGDDVLHILCDHPAMPKFIAAKAWSWFAYPNPEPAIVERIAGQFSKSGLNIKMLVRAIMEAPEFYSAKAVRAAYKNPIDFTVPIVRSLGFGELVSGADNAGRLVGRAIQISSKGMGMDPLFPPDVSGWPVGPAWITSATIIERVKFADRVFGVAAQGQGRGNLNLRYPTFALLRDDPTPEGVVRRLLSIFDAPLMESKLSPLVGAAEKASGGRLTALNASATAAAVSRLIFGSPEFQFC